VHKIAERLEPTQSARAVQLWLQAAKGGYVPSMLALASALESTSKEQAQFWQDSAARLTQK
jgi:hypothetical protein